jgi:hypothetical protein
MSASDGAHKANHPYHLVNPSPWPLTGSLGGLMFTFGMVQYMHDKPLGGLPAIWWIVPGIVFILGTMFFWFSDIVDEGEHQGHHTQVVHSSPPSSGLSSMHRSSRRKRSAISGHRRRSARSTLSSCRCSTR